MLRMLRLNRPLKILVTAAIITGLTFYLWPQIFNKPDGLTVTVLDVGQGDTILIRTPDNHKLLIDGGPDNSILTKLSREIGLFDHHIDMVLLTHPHADHLAGLHGVLKYYQVDRIYLTGVVYTTNSYLSWLSLIKNKNIPIEIVKYPDQLKLSNNLTIEVLYPLKSLAGEQFKNLNNSSIVLKFNYENVKVLLTGDAEKEAEMILVNSGLDLKADILKVGHHGSKTSSTQAFINKVRPSLAIVSVGEGNTYHLPNEPVLQRLRDFGAEIQRTDFDGDIKIRIKNGAWALVN